VRTSRGERGLSGRQERTRDLHLGRPAAVPITRKDTKGEKIEKKGGEREKKRK